MSEDLRNPYIILGLDFGASKDEARRAFARASRHVKRATTSPYTIEDITWALHQVEKVHDDPDAAVSIFRVPANAELFQVAQNEGLFAAPPEPMDRRSSSPSEDEIETLNLRALRELVVKVLSNLGPLPVADTAYEIAGGTR